MTKSPMSSAAHPRTGRSAWRHAVLLGALTLMTSGCLAPSYLGIDEPYSSGSTVLETYCLAYDSAVMAQIFPVFVLSAKNSNDPSWDAVMTMAMPFAFASMVIFGTLMLPFSALADLFG